MSLFTPRNKLFDSRGARRRNRRRRRLGLLVALVALLAGGAYALSQAPVDLLGAASGDERRPYGSSEGERRPEPREARSGGGSAGGAVGEREEASGGGAPEPEPVPEEAKETPAGAAYWAVASGLPNVGPESLKAVYRSKMDPSWASAHITPFNEGRAYVVFVRKDDGVWKAERSIRADEPDYAKNDLVACKNVPKDLKDYLYPENAFAADVPEPEPVKVDRGALPEPGPAEFSPPEPVTDGVPEAESERVEAVLEEVREKVEGYEGVAGLYVRELGDDGDGEGFGYGVRPDEPFFSASVIKVPVMVAVYRKVDEGELSFSQQIEIKDEDWAAGAGWLQWEEAGTRHTVGDLLILMMTQSDNVATNALVRTVGGRDQVNEVADFLSAKNTLLYQKVSSERGAVPALDNRTTARDMATMMQKIADGEAASPKSCGYMIDLMHLNELDWWLDAGLPAGVDAANKAGWLYKVYDEAGIVEADGRRYTVAIMTKYGPQNVNVGRLLIEELSRDVYEGQKDGS